MADNITHLNSNTKLQFIIVPSGHNYTTPQNKTGLIIFREGSNIIEVNGHSYQADNGEFTKLSAVITSLIANKLLSASEPDSNGVITYTPVDKIGNLTVQGLNSGNAISTVTDAISLLKNQYGAITVNSQTQTNGNITLTGSNINLSSTDSTKVSALPKTVNSQAPSDGNITLTGDNINFSATDSTKISALTGAKFDIGGGGNHSNTKINIAIEELYTLYGNLDKDSFLQEGKLVWGPATVTIDSVSSPTQGTYKVNQTVNQYTDKFGTGTDCLIKDVEGAGLKPFLQLIIKSGSDASAVTESYVLIAADKLVDVYTGSANSSDTITISVDANNHINAATTQAKIRTLLGIDSESSATGFVNSGTPTAESNVAKNDYVYVSGNVTVKTQYGAVKNDGGVTVTSVAVDKAGAANAAYTAALGANTDDAGAKTIHGALKEAAKHTTVTGSGSGAASTNDYIVVTDSAASGEAHSYTVKTTQALDTAITTAASNAAANIITWNVIS